VEGQEAKGGLGTKRVVKDHGVGDCQAVANMKEFCFDESGKVVTGWKSKAMMRCIPLCPVLPTRHVRSFTMLQMAGALKVTPQIGSGIIHPFSC